MSSLFQRLTGLSFRSEMLLINLLGLVDSTLDWSSHKWTDQVEKVWNLSLTRTSFAYNTIDEDQVKTILTWIVVTRVIVANLYTCAYLANIFAVLTWTRPFLLLPWLMVSVFKNFFIEILIILIGLLLSYEEELPRALVIEFVIVKVMDFVLASYTLCANTHLYLYLKYRERLQELRESENSDSCSIEGVPEKLMESIKQSKYRSRSLSALTLSSWSSNSNGSDSLSRILNDPVATPAQKARIVLGLTEIEIINTTKRSSESRLLDSLALDTEHEFSQYLDFASPHPKKQETETVFLGTSRVETPIQTEFEEKDSNKTLESNLDIIEIIEEETKDASKETVPSTCDSSPSNDTEEVCLEDKVNRKLNGSREKPRVRSSSPNSEFSKLETKRDQQPCAAIMRKKETKFCPFTKIGLNCDKLVDNQSHQLEGKNTAENLESLPDPCEMNLCTIIEEADKLSSKTVVQNDTFCKTPEKITEESTNLKDRYLTDALALKRKLEEEDAIIRWQQKIPKVDFVAEMALQINVGNTVADTNGNTISDQSIPIPIVAADKKSLPCSGANRNVAVNNATKLTKDKKHSKPAAKENAKKTNECRIQRNETSRDTTSTFVEMTTRTTQTPTKHQKKKHFYKESSHHTLTEQISKLRSPNIKPRKRYFPRRSGQNSSSNCCWKNNEDPKIPLDSQKSGDKKMATYNIENCQPLEFSETPIFTGFDNITIRKKWDRSLTRTTEKTESREKKVGANVKDTKSSKNGKQKSKKSPNQNIQATSSQEMRALRAYNELTLLEDKKALEEARLSRNSESKSKVSDEKSTTMNSVTLKKKIRNSSDKASSSGEFEWNKENFLHVSPNFEYTGNIRDILLEDFNLAVMPFEELDSFLRKEQRSSDKLELLTDIVVGEHETNRRAKMESEKMNKIFSEKVEDTKTDEHREQSPREKVVENTDFLTTQHGICDEPKSKNVHNFTINFPKQIVTSEIPCVDSLTTAPFQVVETDIDRKDHFGSSLFAKPKLEKLCHDKLTLPFDDQKTESLRFEVNTKSTDFRTPSFIDLQDIPPVVQNSSVPDSNVSSHIFTFKAPEDNSVESAISKNECSANENILENCNTEVEKSDNTSRLQDDGKLISNAIPEVNENKDILVEGVGKKIVIDEESSEKDSPEFPTSSKDILLDMDVPFPVKNPIGTEVFPTTLLQSEPAKIKTKCEESISENEKSPDDMLLKKNSPEPNSANITVLINIEEVRNLKISPPEKCSDLSQDTHSDVISEDKSKSSCETVEDPTAITSTSRNTDSEDVAEQNIEKVEDELLESDIVNTFDDDLRFLSVDYESEEGTQFSRILFLCYSTVFSLIYIFFLTIFYLLRATWRRLRGFRRATPLANSEATAPGTFEDEAENNTLRNIIEPLDEEDTFDETLELIRKAENIDELADQLVRTDLKEEAGEEILKPVQEEVDNTTKEVSPIAKKSSLDPETSILLGNLVSPVEKIGVSEEGNPVKLEKLDVESNKRKDDTTKEKLSPIAQPDMFSRYRNPNDVELDDSMMPSFIKDTVAAFFNASLDKASALDIESMGNKEKDVSVASSNLDIIDMDEFNNLVQQFSGMSVRPPQVTDSFDSMYSAQLKKSTDAVSLENASDFEEFPTDRATCQPQSTDSPNIPE